jgi:uncharacterized protein YidB (DUF937 family)
MGIFDILKGLGGQKSAPAAGGGVAGAGTVPEAAGQAGIESTIAGLLGEGGSSLPAVLDKLHAGGLGQIAQSWVSKGVNLPVSAAQIKSALGSDALQGIASKLGISPDDAANKVAAVLPGVIDKLTPDGVVPDPQALAQKLTGLLKQ